MTIEPGSALPAEVAYRLWAATYDDENPLTALDQRAATCLTPSPRTGRLLDMGCGTARRLASSSGDGSDAAVGIDLVFEMLRVGRRQPGRPATTAVGRVEALPLPGRSFGTVWCRLAAGHVRELDRLYREIARVLLPGGASVVTDFHPDAARADLTRSFRDEAGQDRLVEHIPHEPMAHEEAARRAGLLLDARLDLALGDDARPFFERAGALDRFERLRALPLLLAYRFCRPAGSDVA